MPNSGEAFFACFHAAAHLLGNGAAVDVVVDPRLVTAFATQQIVDRYAVLLAFDVPTARCLWLRARP